MQSNSLIAICFALVSFLFISGPVSADASDPVQNFEEVMEPLAEDDC